ncbi:hypothetical protein [Aliarcobacter skirrowii]|uniref:Membrane protein n=1 Tax=Aliarcobacter skirrowii CCUG 10374 TaxID=1032239 RepID=A0AAD0SL81_9BACT|nr:hypothetical protein [Aliarcobacter skirrowii]AXX84650.1 putative membrane protein [Aliarcobacter skirrowii CCUG 10374]KAB0620195.1 hypothetical protein F7P70_08065 [Aliarcobacter skirrowii CCUG 10374]RXI25378.1 hypothetical protein CP959_08095 [Aliarcobacter skirrowii CCUG 10374]SUV14819.1 Uncharacterised protein [Aliarcobacter skirrowii]
MEQRSIWWKVVFWIGIIFLSSLNVWLFSEDYIFLENNIFSNIYIGLIYLIIFISFFGVWGFVYQKRVFYQEFWIYIFFIVLVDFIGTYIVPPIETSTQEIDFLTIIFELLILIAIFLYFYALYQYAFKMKDLWSENDK